MNKLIIWIGINYGILHLSQIVNGANILCIAPYYMKSHYNVFRLVFLELANRGHNVTVLSPFKEGTVPENYHHIQSDRLELIPSDSENVNMFESMKRKPFLSHILNMHYAQRQLSMKIMQSKSVKDFVDNDTTHFDLIIAEDFRFPPFFILAHKYKSPLITYVTFGSVRWLEHYMGNPMNLQHVPHELLDYSDKMTLWERVKNVVYTIAELLLKEFYYKPMNERFTEVFYEKLPKPLPKAADLEKNVSLSFLNTHFSMDVVRSYLPNMVEVGGLHIKPMEKLPEDLQTILDNAKDGVIYFSMGSILPGHHMPKEKVHVFLEVFRNLKQTVLWKWEKGDMGNKPENVIVRKWFPQSDVLGHPNIRLFITHGGLLSFQEAVYRGVPIIGIPIFAEQPSNMKRAKMLGVGEYLDFESINIEDTSKTINMVLNNPKYTEKVMEISSRINDKPMTAMETAVFWIEYVIRHKGAYHMKSPSSHMFWYEYYLLDVVALITLLCVGILVAMFIVFKISWCAVSTLYNMKRNRITRHNKNK